MPLTSTELQLLAQQISVFKSRYQTCPLIAYYMLREHITYTEAVQYAQKRNRILNEMDLFFLDLFTDSHFRQIMKYKLETGLKYEEVDLLMQVENGHHDVNQPTDRELDQIHPNREIAAWMFLYGMSEEEARAKICPKRTRAERRIALTVTHPIRKLKKEDPI